MCENLAWLWPLIKDIGSLLGNIATVFGVGYVFLKGREKINEYLHCERTRKNGEWAEQIHFLFKREKNDFITLAILCEDMVGGKKINFPEARNNAYLLYNEAYHIVMKIGDSGLLNKILDLKDKLDDVSKAYTVFEADPDGSSNGSPVKNTLLQSKREIKNILRNIKGELTKLMQLKQPNIFSSW